MTPTEIAPLPTRHARRLDAHLLRMLAVEAAADPRSVQKFLNGEPLRSSLTTRIARAVRTLERRGDWPLGRGESKHREGGSNGQCVG